MPDTDRHDVPELGHELSTSGQEVGWNTAHSGRRISSFELHAIARKARAQAQRDWVLACISRIMAPVSRTRGSGVHTSFSIDPHR